MDGTKYEVMVKVSSSGINNQAILEILRNDPRFEKVVKLTTDQERSDILITDDENLALKQMNEEMPTIFFCSMPGDRSRAIELLNTGNVSSLSVIEESSEDEVPAVNKVVDLMLDLCDIKQVA